MRTKVSKPHPKSQGPRPPFAKQKKSARAGTGHEKNLAPRPEFKAPLYRAAGKLNGMKALITGGDSGIGRAVAVLYAREGADVAISFIKGELDDAEETKRLVEDCGRECVLIEADLSNPKTCESTVQTAVKELGGLDILVSNAAHQMRKEKPEDISTEEWRKTFQTNVEAYFHLVKYALPHLGPGSSIIATSSETSIFGNKQLLDYSATKGAIDAFTRSLAQNLLERGIRVNAVAPGPVWTPLNPSDKGASEKHTREFGKKTPMGRPAQPEEIAPAYVFLASPADSSYITGLVLPELGGETVH